MAQLVKKSTCNAETWVQPRGWEDTLEKGKATQLQYSPWVPKELDMTERLSLSPVININQAQRSGLALLNWQKCLEHVVV